MVRWWWWLKSPSRPYHHITKWTNFNLVTPKQVLSESRDLLNGNEGRVWGEATRLLQSRGRIPATRNRASSLIIAAKSTDHRRMTKSIAPGAGKVSWLKFSQDKTSFVRSLFAGLSLRQKIHSTWCIHCFQSNTHQGPHLWAWILYNNSSLHKKLKTSAGTECMNVTKKGE